AAAGPSLAGPCAADAGRALPDLLLLAAGPDRRPGVTRARPDGPGGVAGADPRPAGGGTRVVREARPGAGVLTAPAPADSYHRRRTDCRRGVAHVESCLSASRALLS